MQASHHKKENNRTFNALFLKQGQMLPDKYTLLETHPAEREFYVGLFRIGREEGDHVGSTE